MHHLRGIIALLIVTIVWGTTFPAMKDLSSDLTAVWIAFVRFAIGGLMLSPFLLRGRRIDFSAGALLGALLFAAFMLQVTALGMMNANRNAFITGLNVLIVPLLGVLAGRLPEKRIVLAVLLSIAGLFAMCWEEGGAWSDGDTLALVGAVIFGVYVKAMEITTRRATSLMALTAVQVGTVALCAAGWIALVEPPSAFGPIADGIRTHFWNLLYLGAIATAAIIALQTWGQRHASANEAAIIYAFEPATAAIAAWFWLGETMSLRAMVGGVLLIGGMIVSQWSPSPRASRMAGAGSES